MNFECILKIIGTVSDLLNLMCTVVGVFLSIIAAIMVIVEWKHKMKFDKSKWIFEIMKNINDDELARRGMYLLDYSDKKKWYSEDFHEFHEDKNPINNDQICIDKALYWFNYICYLKDKKEISDKEYSIFKYDIEKLFAENEQFCNYMYNLFHYCNFFDEKANPESKLEPPFYYIYKISEERNLIPEEFSSKNACYKPRITTKRFPTKEFYYKNYIGFK